jgi:hypothetical protein
VVPLLSWGAQTPAGFGIYLTVVPIDLTNESLRHQVEDMRPPRILDISNIPLEEIPLIAEGDIEGFDAAQGVITLKPESIERIGRRFEPGELIGGRSFVVVASGERIFLGGFRSFYSSYGSLPVPTLLFDVPAGPAHSLNSRMLNPAPRSISPTWSDPRITAALSHVSSEGAQKTKAPNQSVEPTADCAQLSFLSQKSAVAHAHR